MYAETKYLKVGDLPPSLPFKIRNAVKIYYSLRQLRLPECERRVRDGFKINLICVD
jgi:hypothetical protein